MDLLDEHKCFQWALALLAYEKPVSSLHLWQWESTQNFSSWFGRLCISPYKCKWRSLDGKKRATNGVYPQTWSGLWIRTWSKI